MKAPALGEHLLSSQASHYQLASVADHRGVREPRDVAVGNSHRVPNPVGESAQSGAQHHGHLRPARPNLSTYRFSSCFDLVHRVILPLLELYARLAWSPPGAAGLD